MSDATKAGFAAVIGAPNAGKSTLVNRLVGSKVSIVTQKVQTTRFPVRGVAMEGQSQVILVDTPGVFSPRRRLDRAMVRAAWTGAEEADAVVHLVDVRAELAVQDGHATGADRLGVEDSRTVIEGPFAHPRELVAGFWLWKVKDMAEAVAWVKHCPNPMPGPSEIEIRPLQEMDDLK